MRKYIQITLCLVLFLSVNGTTSYAKSLDSAAWAKMAEEYDYPPPKERKKLEEVEEKENKSETIKEPRRPMRGLDFGNVLIYIGIAVLFVLLIVVLIKAGVIKVGSRRVVLNQTFDAENPEELVLTELEKELNNAAIENNYNRCLRYEFLLLLERLQSLGLIRWHKYNTNGEYLNQIIDYKFHKRIRNLTIVYEYYWYGEHVLSLSDYEKLAVSFNQLKEEMI